MMLCFEYFVGRISKKVVAGKGRKRNQSRSWKWWIKWRWESSVCAGCAECVCVCVGKSRFEIRKLFSLAWIVSSCLERCYDVVGEGYYVKLLELAATQWLFTKSTMDSGEAREVMESKQYGFPSHRHDNFDRVRNPNNQEDQNTIDREGTRKEKKSREGTGLYWKAPRLHCPFRTPSTSIHPSIHTSIHTHTYIPTQFINSSISSSLTSTSTHIPILISKPYHGTNLSDTYLSLPSSSNHPSTQIFSA